MELIDKFALALQGPMLWTESYRLYGERTGTYTNYVDGIAFSTYNDDYFFAECLVCGDCTKLSASSQEAIDRHFEHCARVHDYVYPLDTKLKVHDRQLQDIIRLAQEYELSIPHLSDHSACIKQYIELTDGSMVVGCGVHKGNEAKIWMGVY